MGRQTVFGGVADWVEIAEGEIEARGERVFSGYPAMASGNAPRVRSRFPNSSTAALRSAAVKSGQRFCVKTNSAKAHSHKRKSESRCSPPVRISKSTSVEPPRWTSASTVLKDSGESSVTL